jgi:ABC-type uncharacterized transport system substrate-binding protein
VTGFREEETGMPRIQGLLYAFLGLLFLASPASAHPHAWIEMETRLIFDKEERARSLEIVWTFDEFFSLYALSKPASEASDEEMRQLVAEYVAGLQDFGYFTEVTSNGEKVAITEVASQDARSRGEQLVMIFEVAFERPLDPLAEKIAYAVYDPTYYIEILHETPDSAHLGEGAPAGCGVAILPPNPDPETIGLAAALGPNESAGDWLGSIFAERVEVRC